MLRRLSLTITLLALGGMLSACAPGMPVASPTPTSSPSAEPTPTPEPSIITLAADGFIVDGPGEPVAFDFFAPTDTVVAALTSLFGFDPTVTSETFSNTDIAGYVMYTWEGFAFSEMQAGDPSPLYPPGAITITTPRVGDVELVTAGGIQVGDLAPALETPFLPTGVALETHDLGGEPEPGSGPMLWYLIGSSDTVGGPIVRISAPNRSYGP